MITVTVSGLGSEPHKYVFFETGYDYNTYI